MEAPSNYRIMRDAWYDNGMANKRTPDITEGELSSMMHEMYNMMHRLHESWQGVDPDSPQYVVLETVRGGMSIATNMLHHYLYGELKTLRS